ncbi:hypothetical protein HDV02_004605 [Globomyces sp. JEL0801]|nr:hypothetical protein HDV02_004605 [Globomyces sp. JEL0801]
MLETKCNDGTPTHSIWSNTINSFFKAFLPDPTKEKVRREYLNYAGRINAILREFLKMIDYPVENTFKCCEDPEVVCIDGIVLSVENRKIKGQNLVEPWHDTSFKTKERFNYRNKDRAIIHFNKDTKEMFKKFRKRTGGIDEAELQELEDLYNHDGVEKHPLMEFIRECCECDGRYIGPICLRDFFSFLSKDISPACSLLPYCLWPTIEDFITTMKISEEHLQLINVSAPVLFQLVIFLVTDCSTNVLKRTICFKLLEYILGTAKACFTQSNPKYVKNVKDVEPSLEEYASAREELMKTAKLERSFLADRIFARLAILNFPTIMNINAIINLRKQED